jgi:small subunit ribosomal protein S16
MAVKIRLTRVGKKNNAKYRIIIIEENKKRNGRYIEKIGYYDPIPDPSIIKIDRERLNYWISKGAQMSQGFSKLIKLWKNS